MNDGEESAQYLEEELKKRLRPVNLEKVEDSSLTFRITGPIFHKIGMEGKQIGHLIESEVRLSWLPKLSDLELLTNYLKFMRALCEVTRFPSEQDKLHTILAKTGRGI